MANLFDRAGHACATAGTGTLTLGAALGAVAPNVCSFQSFATAGVATGAIVSYLILDANGAWETGWGVYTSAGTTLTRNVTASSAGTTAITLSGSEQIYITMRAEDVAQVFGQCRLTFVSATSLSLVPYQGNKITISNSNQVIPDAGVTVTNGGLSASTLYYVYAFMSAGTMTLEVVTTTHATQAGSGVEIKSGDATRSLVGMVFTNGSSQFDQSATKINVVSWFNRQGLAGANGLAAITATTTTNAWAEVTSNLRIEFCIWSSEVADLAFSGGCFLNVGTDQVYLGLAFDNATTPEIGTFPMQNSSAGDQHIGPAGISSKKGGLSEGHHFATLSAIQTVGSSAAEITGSATTNRQSALYLIIRG